MEATACKYPGGSKVSRRDFFDSLRTRLCQDFLWPSPRRAKVRAGETFLGILKEGVAGCRIDAQRRFIFAPSAQSLATTSSCRRKRRGRSRMEETHAAERLVTSARMPSPFCPRLNSHRADQLKSSWKRRTSFPCSRKLLTFFETSDSHFRNRLREHLCCSFKDSFQVHLQGNEKFLFLAGGGFFLPARHFL